MADSIKVSVVIPVYNVELYVEDAINSILRQSLHEIEIIIVNDGSTDGSMEIVKELAISDKRMQIISNPNQGLSIARNLGIYRAKGEYIYFFDSDDLLEENALELCYNKCQSNCLDFVFFDADVFSDKKSLLAKNEFNYKRTNRFQDVTLSGIDMLIMQMSMNGYTSSACLIFINRNFLSNIQLYFYPKIVHEDELFTFMLYLNAERVGLVRNILFHRRVRNGSIMTNSYTLLNAMGCITVCRELLSYSHRCTLSSLQRKLLYRRMRQLLAITIIKSSETLSIIEYKKIKQIIYSEFFKYLGWKNWIRIGCPSLYRFYVKRL